MNLQFTITVPGMHSVSEMYDTVRAVCPAPTKQSSLVLLRKLIIGLSLTNIVNWHKTVKGRAAKTQDKFGMPWFP